MIPQKAKDILERLMLNDDLSNYEYNYLKALLSNPSKINIQDYTSTSTIDNFKVINTLPESKL